MDAETPHFEAPKAVTSIIDGAAVPASGEALPVIYPATGQPVSTLYEADAGEVDAAVRAARRAFDRSDWPRWGVEKRQDLFEALRQVILNHADELAYLECLNTGLVLREVRERHIKRAAYNFKFFAEFIGQTAGQVYTQNPAYQTIVTREPVGVAALIAPWNAPVALASMKVAAALAFGNTAVLKPSEQTPLALARFVELLHEAGLPPGVLNLVNGRGPVTGAALVDHCGVDLVSFTGGTETGRAIMAAAGRRLVPTTMELGGKSANIIFDSADLDQALNGALLGIFSNNGQQCLAGSRILVQRSIAEDFIARFTDRAQRLKVGDPMAEGTELGPLASQPHMQRVLGFVDTATGEGGHLITGGKRREDLGEGFYIEPTAVMAPSNDAAVCQHEIFGPFASFLTFDEVDEAIALANASKFGLVSYVWSNDLPTVMRASREIRAGVVWVNTPMMRELRAPFGGYKESGVGREGGEACQAFYTEAKTVSIPTEPLQLRRLGDG
jgi:acyl-CoA reductase-like NAD-dependent aldehyde dehydrogenase